MCRFNTCGCRALHQEKPSREADVNFYMNDTPGGFAHLFKNNRHINRLRVFASSTATNQPKVFESSSLVVDECIVLPRRTSGENLAFSEPFDIINSGIIKRWPALVNVGKIKKLTIIHYERESDLWHVICDESRLLTDLFTFNSERYTPYMTHKNKGLMLVSSKTENSKNYIAQYIEQFDNYVSYYKEKNNVLLEKGA